MPQLQSFNIDDVRFILDIRPGKERGVSTDGEFILVKTNAFLEFYRELQEKNPKNILEIGMLQGGSLVLFDKLYAPEKLVGVDIRRKPIAPLERYRDNKEYIVPFYGTSQDDPELSSILQREFPEDIDLIVDDASHQYELTRATFHLCFPFLKPGGVYVVEDWAWSHTPPPQDDTHPWFEKPALTNLIMELLINIPYSKQIDQVTVTRNLASIKKASAATGAIDLDEGHDRLRGRELPLF